MERLKITLDDEYAEKLARLAERTHLQRATVARSLLLIALDDADADARNVVELLDGISGALGRALLGRAQAQAGAAIPQSALREGESADQGGDRGVLSDDFDAEVDRRIVEGYLRLPQTEHEDAWAEANARAAIREEPW